MIVLKTFYFLSKEMVTPSSSLAWKNPWTEEPGRLQSMGSQRVRQEQIHFIYKIVKIIPTSKIHNIAKEIVIRVST